MNEKYSDIILAEMLVEIRNYFDDMHIELIDKNDKYIIQECYHLIRKVGTIK